MTPLSTAKPGEPELVSGELGEVGRQVVIVFIESPFTFLSTRVHQVFFAF